MGTDSLNTLIDYDPKPKKSRPSVEDTSEPTWNYLPTVILHEIYERLSFHDRLNASSTCKNWRQALYRPLYWRNVIFKIDENNATRTRYFLNMFSSIVTNATVRVDLMIPENVADLLMLLQMLVENDFLKSLVLEAKYCRIEVANNADSPEEADLNKIVTTIRKLCCRPMDKFSLGYLEKLTSHIPNLLDKLTLSSANTMTHLGLASIKEEPGVFSRLKFDRNILKPFVNLQVLTVDYEVLDDMFLCNLGWAPHLKRLVIHINVIDDQHPGTTDAEWKRFTQNHPNCELRVNVTHVYEQIYDIHRVFKMNMPLSHLKVFFCEGINTQLLHNISSWYSQTFRSIVWVDCLSQYDNPASWGLLDQPVFEDGQEPDPLVMIAWLCPKFEEMVLIGYKYHEENLLAIARLRTDTLKVFDVTWNDIILTNQDAYHCVSIKDEVPILLKRPWAPLQRNQLHPVICDPNLGDSDEYILPILLADLQ